MMDEWLDPKDPIASIIIERDLSKITGSDAVIETAVYTASTFRDGVQDPDAQDVIVGDVETDGRVVRQRIEGGLDGANYKLKVQFDYKPSAESEETYTDVDVVYLPVRVM